jgi:hypothetical protein
MMADQDEALAVRYWLEQEWQTEDKIRSLYLLLDKRSGWIPRI